jgi:hypothetical protein
MDDLAGGRPETESFVVAYCVHCRTRRAMQSAIQVCTTRGRHALKGVCAVCGKGMYRLGGWDSIMTAAKRTQNDAESGASAE